MAFFVFIFLQSELEDGVRENQVRFGEKKIRIEMIFLALINKDQKSRLDCPFLTYLASSLN